MPIALRYAARSDIGLGSKNRNEDSGYASSTMLLLADGMGGHAAGDVASSTVARSIAPLDEEEVGADDALDQLRHAIDAANARLRLEMDLNPTREGMGTTLIVLLKAGKQLAMANIGDSRAYQLHEGKFTQITKDHSFVQSLLDAGTITPEEAVHHPRRSLVTRVLTGRDSDMPDLSLREAHIGDRYLLCSDGLSDYVGARTIEEIFSQTTKSVDEVAQELIEIALKASTLDNVTVLVGEVIDADDADPASQPAYVGAVSTAPETPTAIDREPTPAEKARALARESEDQDDEPHGAILAEEKPHRSGRFKLGVASLGALLILAIAAVSGWVWSQNQYYVKSSYGKVAIFQGVDGSLGPIRLHHVVQKSDIRTSDLQTFWRERVAAGMDSTSRKDAEATLQRLNTELNPCPSGTHRSGTSSECAK